MKRVEILPQESGCHPQAMLSPGREGAPVPLPSNFNSGFKSGIIPNKALNHKPRE